MSLDMTPEQKEIGKANFNRVVGKLAEADQQTQDQQEQGVTRRRFMQGLIAAGATAPVSAAAYFGYRYHGFPSEFRPVRAALIGCGDEGGVLVGEHNPNFVKFIACCDVRPTNMRRIFTGEPLPSPRRGFNYHYGINAKQQITQYDDYRQLLAHPAVEMVVIALPLHLHAQVAIDAMNAGKHVLCEKLMAWNIRQCKQMIRVANDTDKLLSIGHQRHYSMLYAHANELITRRENGDPGILGEIKHIRALWHRNNVRPNPDANTRRDRPFLDSWFPLIPAEDREQLTSARLRALGYKDINELCRWRLYTRTGGGLMAELGSHQLDACSIFLGKKRPLSVTAVGGTHFYSDDREVEDHVYCIYEFPGEKYNPHNASSRRNDIVTVTYSSISTNGFEPYGECIMGTKGTLVVEQEQAAYLWGLQGRSTDVTASSGPGGAPVMDTSSSSAPTERQAAATGANAIGQNAVSRGYREEMEHLAYCIRMRELGMESDRDQLKPRCGGPAAMADAVIALTANQAMKKRKRIEFKPEWFDAASEQVPDADMVEQPPR